jgi:fatty-acyl-CoA synthase
MERYRAILLYVKDTGAQISEEEIKNWARVMLAANKELAGEIVFVDTVPINGSGKMLRRLLQETEPRSRDGSKFK